MNIQLVQAAMKALTDENFVRERDECQKWVRQVIESIYGEEYEQFRAGTAIGAAHLWSHSDFALNPLTHDSEPGDILYKPADVHMPRGHVGIRVENNMVAENSSSHVSPTGDARGLRTIEKFGPALLVVRLPEKQ